MDNASHDSRQVKNAYASSAKAESQDFIINNKYIL